MKRYVVCYDVHDNSGRTKLMKKLRNKGFHSQLSFFEVEGSNPGEIVPEVRGLLEKTDRYSVIRLSKRGKIRRIGSLLEGMEWVL